MGSIRRCPRSEAPTFPFPLSDDKSTERPARPGIGYRSVKPCWVSIRQTLHPIGTGLEQGLDILKGSRARPGHGEGGINPSNPGRWAEGQRPGGINGRGIGGQNNNNSRRPSGPTQNCSVQCSAQLGSVTAQLRGTSCLSKKNVYAPF